MTTEPAPLTEEADPEVLEDAVDRAVEIGVSADDAVQDVADGEQDEAEDEDKEEDPGEDEEEDDEEAEDEDEDEEEEEAVTRYINYAVFGTVELPVPGQPLALALDLDLSVIKKMMIFTMSPRGEKKAWDNVFGFDHFDVRSASFPDDVTYSLIYCSSKTFHSKSVIRLDSKQRTIPMV